MTITGKDFTGLYGPSAVAFGGTNAVSYAVDSDDADNRGRASHVNGQVEVLVRAAGGTAGQAYTYIAPTITSVSPTMAGAAGGIPVTIRGSGFAPVATAGSVWFGGVKSADVTVNSDTEIVAVAPPHEPGTVYIVVDDAADSTGQHASGRFTYVVAPTITLDQPLLRLRRRRQFRHHHRDGLRRNLRTGSRHLRRGQRQLQRLFLDQDQRDRPGSRRGHSEGQGDRDRGLDRGYSRCSVRLHPATAHHHLDESVLRSDIRRYLGGHHRQLLHRALGRRRREVRRPHRGRLHRELRDPDNRGVPGSRPRHRPGDGDRFRRRPRPTRRPTISSTCQTTGPPSSLSPPHHEQQL